MRTIVVPISFPGARTALIILLKIASIHLPECSPQHHSMTVRDSERAAVITNTYHASKPLKPCQGASFFEIRGSIKRINPTSLSRRIHLTDGPPQL